VDLIQVHSLDSTDDLATIVGPDGALAALSEARDQGLARFIGVSGHVAEVMLAAIDAFPFDTVLMRINPLDPIRGDFAGNVLPVARARGIGIIAMKVMDRGRLLDGRSSPQTLLRYTLSHAVSTAIVGCGSIEELESNVAACRNFRPMTEAQMQALEDIYCG